MRVQSVRSAARQDHAGGLLGLEFRVRAGINAV